MSPMYALDRIPGAADRAKPEGRRRWMGVCHLLRCSPTMYGRGLAFPDNPIGASWDGQAAEAVATKKHRQDNTTRKACIYSFVKDINVSQDTSIFKAYTKTPFPYRKTDLINRGVTSRCSQKNHTGVPLTLSIRVARRSIDQNFQQRLLPFYDWRSRGQESRTYVGGRRGCTSQRRRRRGNVVMRMKSSNTGLVGSLPPHLNIATEPNYGNYITTDIVSRIRTAVRWGACK